MGTRFAIGLASTAAAAWLAAGCLSEARTETDPGPPASTPQQELAAAAEITYSEPVGSLGIAALGEPSPWTGSGLIELEQGRYRIEAEPDRPHRVGADLVRDGVTVVGLEGEGFEGTVLETVGGIFGRGDGERRCWFNPHAPVGFYADPISVEEAVRLTGSIVESLRTEIATARAAGGDAFEVELARSAQEPRGDFHDGERRVWGDRALIGDLARPIEVAVADGRIDRISYELVHQPDYDDLPLDRSPRDVRIEAVIEPTDEDLVLDPPNCQAIE